MLLDEEHNEPYAGKLPFELKIQAMKSNSINDVQSNYWLARSPCQKADREVAWCELNLSLASKYASDLCKTVVEESPVAFFFVQSQPKCVPQLWDTQGSISVPNAGLQLAGWRECGRV